MKKILLIVIMSLIAFIAKSEDLTKLSKEKRIERLIKISKKTALKYGDSRYWVDGADYEVTILPANPNNPYSKKEKYRIRFTNKFAKKYMEYGYLVRVDIETETGRAIAIDFGNGWGVPVKNDNKKTKTSQKIEKMPYQHLPIKDK